MIRNGDRIGLRLMDFACALLLIVSAPVAPASSAGGDVIIKSQGWSFNGPFGTFDRAQLQRGFQVYQEVCAACHGMRYLHYRNLSEAGGPEFPEAAAKVVAASVEVEDGPDDQGDMYLRPGRLSDPFVSPFRNDQEGRAANNGALPPDLSLIAKARPHGVDYLYSVLTGYVDPPAGFHLAEGMFYNSAFPGHQLAMPMPLENGVIDYTDGTPATSDNYAKDVTAFMMWAAEPKLEERHRVGFRAMIYLLLLSGLLYIAKRRVWRKIPH